MIRQRIRLVLLGLLLFALAPLSKSYAPEVVRGATPVDFTDTQVVTVASPTAFAFLPTGQMLITSQLGQLRIYTGSQPALIALDLSARVCGDFERGLLGVAVDPQFSTNRYIYLYYTFKKFGGCERNTANSPVNRVSRFTLSTNNVVDAASELVLVDNMPSPNGNHNGGDIQFGKDGNLYIGVGDGGCDYAGGGCAGSNDAARDQHVLLGKVLRITPTGGIPAGNPYTGTGTARCNVTGRTTAGTRCQETFAWGLRNPFRLVFDPNAAGTRFFINDVGQNAWEEIDLGQAGADYGWNVREGDCANGSTTNCGAPPAGMTNPVYDYGRSTGCASITGGAFVPNGIWPASYNGAYLYADYVCGKIVTLRPASGGYTASDFATALGSSSVVHMAFGPHGTTQALYYSTYGGGGQIRRIAYTGTANRPPVAALSASPTSGPAPLAVTFNGSGSSDPDAGNTLTYLWDFGDGSPVHQTTTATTSYTYAAAGSFTASLRVRDNLGATSTPATVQIFPGNTPPRASITAPATTTRFRVGQTITLQGSASDDQDGVLPATSLSWRVIQHHIVNGSTTTAHTHPFMPPTTGNNLTFVAPGPEDLQATENSYLEIELTATDSRGLTTVVRQPLYPNKVSLTFASDPTGRTLVANELSFAAPRTLVTWEGHALNVNAPNQSSGGQTFVFAAWSDGGAQAHTIVAPASAASYTAAFSAMGVTATRTSTGVVPSPTRTSTGIVASPTRTRTSTGVVPSPTRTSTSGPLPTATRTRTPTSGTGGTCSPATAITAPFTRDGSGSFCWQIATIPSYINSWNLNSLTINGVNFTNLYATPSQLPPKINGYWYIAYNSSVAWGHFEVR